MGYILKLKKGGKTLDLSSGIYALDQWVPPRANIISNIAHGTSANRYGGGVKVSERAVNTSTVFSIRILGGSNAECEAGARRIENFLRQAGDEAEPMYLEWRPDNNVSFEPLWGQTGANIRYEVVSGQVDKWNAYFVAQLRNTAMFINVMLELKPFAIGKRQKVATAKGGILINTIGTTDGSPRGVIVAEETTNKMTNPIFGHSTWNTGWTAGASLVESQNTDSDFLLFGSSSAKLVNPTSGAISYRQSIDVGDTNAYILSCYAKRADGDAVTSSDLAMYYGTAQTTAFSSVGNGWYRCSSSVTGVASATNTGINVAAYRSIYVDGFQIENKNYATPLAYGDMLGCAWSSTAHESSTSRTASFYRIPYGDAINVMEGTIRYVWKAPCASTVYDGAGIDARLMKSGATAAFVLSWNSSTSKWNFTDGSSTIVPSSTTPFSAGEIIVFHCVFGPGVLKLYINGAEAATNSTYIQPATSTWMYIGSTNTPDLHNNGLVLGWESYAYAMSATEVSNDYSNVYEAVTSGDGLGRELMPLPWLWTKDGDNVVDNCNDDDYDNYCVVGGIPGSANAETEYRIAMSNIAARQAIIGIMTHDYGSFVKPDDYLYGEQDGTADGGSSNGEYYTKTSVSTTTTLIGPSSTTLSQRGVEALLGRDIYMVARLYDASASTLQLAVYRPGFYSGSVYEWHNNTMPATTWGLHRTDAISLPTKAELFQTLVYSERSISNKSFGLYGRHVSGTSDVRIDFWAIMPRPMAILGDGDAVSGAGWVLNGRKIINMDSTFATLYKRAAMSGDTLDLFPNQLNVLVSLLGYASDATISRTLTYTVYVTPRWSLA